MLFWLKIHFLSVLSLKCNYCKFLIFKMIYRQFTEFFTFKVTKCYKLSLQMKLNTLMSHLIISLLKQSPVINKNTLNFHY